MQTRRDDDGERFYCDLGMPLFEHLREKVSTNLEVTMKAMGPVFARMERKLDVQYRIARHYVWAFGTPFFPGDKLSSLVLSAFHKNLFSFFSVVEFTRMGLHGSARILLRQILEWLVVAKFCSVFQNTEVLDRWTNGESIGLSRDVLNHIKNPNMVPLRELWACLCQFTHATRFAQQVGMDLSFELDRKAFLAALSILEALVECNNILLTRHLENPTLVYYSKRYSQPHQVSELKREAKALYQETSKRLPLDIRKCVRIYRARWTLK